MNDLPNPPGSEPAPGADNTVCYHQNCPVCGRVLLVRVTLLGRTVYCQHCGGGFIASDAVATDGGLPSRQSARVDELLERADVMLGRTGQ